MTIYFYTPREQPYGDFSNFSRHGIEMDGVWWPTVEHYYQAQKFTDPAFRERIQHARHPKHAKALGRMDVVPLRADWDQVKDGVMLAATLRKFETHEAARTLLLSTGDEELVENSPIDYYWGCGADGSGLNKLGKTLMAVRERLRQSGE